MRITTPGRINERLWLLGREDSCVYLLEGTTGSLLINGGLSSLLPDLLKQFRTFGIDPSRITKFLVLHSHFDHVGLVPYFLHRWPEIQLYASPRALEIFQKPKAVRAINDASRFDLTNRGRDGLFADGDLQWRTGLVGEAVDEGGRIDLGDLEVRILATPGHSPCSISAYVPGMQALFPSDAGGIPHCEGIATYGTSNYSQFEASLKKLQQLDVRLYCPDHSGYLTGHEAAGFVTATIAAAAFRRKLMQEIYRYEESIDRTAALLADRYRNENVGSMVPHGTLVEAYRQMIRHVAEMKEVPGCGSAQVG